MNLDHYRDGFISMGVWGGDRLVEGDKLVGGKMVWIHVGLGTSRSGDMIF